MAYNKRIRGDSNSANEEFSHNRITIVAGGAGVIAVCFVCCIILAAILWMALREGALFALLIIGAFLALFGGAGIAGTCFLIVKISDTIYKIRVNRLLSQTIVSGEVVAYRNENEEWDHLSSIHEQGKVIPQLTFKPEKHEPEPSEAWVILDMHKQGIGFKAIAEATQWTEYAVRKLCNNADGKVKG
jgi:hypothetical protein